MSFDISHVATIVSRIVFYVLVILSVLSVGAILERWWWFRRRRSDLPAMSRDLEALLRAGDIEGARARLAADRSVEAVILNDALGWYRSGPDSFQEILGKSIRDQRKGTEGGLLFLGTLGNNAPFIGLFGTVVGIVNAFKGLGSANANAMGNVMSNIAEALAATAVGILVALPAVVAYNVFQKRGADIEENAQGLGNLVLAVMHAQQRGTLGSHPERAHGSATEGSESERLTRAQA
jgi:biopolymer transport protein ExbB/biopolymer transport protein TolQ